MANLITKSLGYVFWHDFAFKLLVTIESNLKVIRYIFLTGRVYLIRMYYTSK